MNLLKSLGKKARKWRDRVLPATGHDLARRTAELSRRIEGDFLFELWKAGGRYDDPRSLSRFDARVYSQNGEDGILAEIFRRIGLGVGFFVEIGVEDGAENNTRLLLEQGWQGVWFEGDPAGVAAAKQNFAAFVEAGKLRVVEAMVSAENINALFAANNVPETFEFLSLDVDFNTSHVWRALRFSPRVACVEYNASLPPSSPLEVPYDPARQWDHTNFYGASLKTLETIGAAKGARLVGCDINGANAFFINDSLIGEAFLAPYAAEFHYEPPRFHRTRISNGHPPGQQARRWTRGE